MCVSHNSIPWISTSGNTQKGIDFMIDIFIAELFIVVEMISKPNIHQQRNDSINYFGTCQNSEIIYTIKKNNKNNKENPYVLTRERIQDLFVGEKSKLRDFPDVQGLKF